MAAALRFAAKRLCSGALERPPRALLTAGRQLAAPTRTLPSRQGGTSLRRPFSNSAAESSSSSAAPNLHSNTSKAESMTSLSARALEKMEELHDIVRQMNRQEYLDYINKVENKRLLQLTIRELRRPTPGSTWEYIEKHKFKMVTGTLVATTALMYLEAKFLFPLIITRLEQQPSSSKKAE